MRSSAFPVSPASAARRCGPFAILLLLPLASAVAQEAIFADGFECCDAASWSGSTGVGACAAGLACGAQDADEICLAGRLFDFATSRPVTTTPSSEATCTTVGQGGPCALAIRAFDALAFLSNPGGATPLTTGESLVDACGRFRLSGVADPSLGFALLAVDDASGAANDHVVSAVARPVAGGDEVEGLTLDAIGIGVDADWTTDAGAPFGADTFASRGAVALVFLHGGEPVAGVTARAQGAADAGADFYFSDPSAGSRVEVDAGAAATGANGTALVADNDLVERDGVGGLAAGCVWESALAGGAAGVVLVQRLRAVVDGEPTQECP
jgi:hypothetical protein